MKKIFLICLGMILPIYVLYAVPANVLRRQVDLSLWSFAKGDVAHAEEVGFDDGTWKKVTIPHDWAIYGPFDKKIDMQVVAIEQNGEKQATEKTGRTGALPYIGVGWYRTEIAAYPGKRVVLMFDGAMSNACVYVNGQEVGSWPYGYNSFYVDISDCLKSDAKNVLAVRLENFGESSRWYPGAGLYRHVYLSVTEPLSIDVWGTFVTTPFVSEQQAKINLKTKVFAVWTPEISSASGPVSASFASLCLKTEIKDKEGRLVASSEDTLLVNNEFEQLFAVSRPQLWSPETPVLYEAVSTLFADGRAVDSYTTRFGIRSISVDAVNGFQLNGKTRKIKGVCLHHDLGPLGAAVNRSALARQLRILKEMGCDAIRSSHNMPSPEQIELCDEMGIMVMAESFDEWARAKCKNGYHLYYDEWVDRDVENLVRHYRNHPSIIMWSAGNEVPDQWTERGIKEGKRLQDMIHREDPTRPVTMGMDQVARTIKNGFAAYWDVPGLNYRLPLYGEAHKLLPQGFLLGSETASTVSSRGVYHFPVKEYKNKAYADGQCSSYDLEACSWSNIPDDDWVWQDDNDWVIGEFVWTGFDYLGEPTPYDEYWPSRSSYFGICDLAGLPKDRYYLYRSRWNTAAHTLHILPHWTWPDKIGDTIPVFVYTDYPSAELFINGQSQGSRSKTAAGNRLDRYRLRWMETVYEPGSLKVVAYDAQGCAVDSQEVHTAGRPHHIALCVEPAVNADDDLIYVRVRIEDAQGNLCPNADNQLSFRVSGEGRFRAACNGDPTSLERFHLPTMKAFNGQLVVIVQKDLSLDSAVGLSASSVKAADKAAGDIRLSVSGKGLKSQSVVIPKAN